MILSKTGQVFKTNYLQHGSHHKSIQVSQIGPSVSPDMVKRFFLMIFLKKNAKTTNALRRYTTHTLISMCLHYYCQFTAVWNRQFINEVTHSYYKIFPSIFCLQIYSKKGQHTYTYGKLIFQLVYSFFHGKL